MDQAEAVQVYPEAKDSWQIAIGLYGKAVAMAAGLGYPLHTIEIDCQGWYFSGDTSFGRPRWGYRELPLVEKGRKPRFCFRFSPEEAASFGIDGYLVYEDGRTGPIHETEAYRKKQEELCELREARGAFLGCLRQRMIAMIAIPTPKKKRTKKKR